MSIPPLWLIWICWAPFITHIFKLDKKDFFFLVVVALAPQAQICSKAPPTDHCLHEIRPSHSPTTMPLLLLHHAFQGRHPSCGIMEMRSTFFLLAQNQSQIHTQMHAHRYRATLVADVKLLSKSRWHIRVTPNSTWPLQCVKATRSMTSVLAIEDWFLSCCLLLLL